MGLSNNNVAVSFASGLPGECTPSSLSTLTARLTELVTADVTATGNTSFYNFGDTEPTPENRIYPWLKTILGFPDNWYVYVDGAWRPVNAQRLWFCGNAGGVADVYTATTAQSYSSTVLIQTGDTFLVKILLANTGPATLAINGFPAAAIQNAGVALVADELIANQTYIFTWDGTYFRLLNPTPLEISVALTKSFVSSQIPIGAAGTTGTPVAHGLGEMPKVLEGRLVCLAPDLGVAAGKEIPLKDFSWHYVSGSDDAAGTAIVLDSDSVNVTPLWNWNGSSNEILYKQTTSSTWAAIDTSKWALIFRAFA